MSQIPKQREMFRSESPKASPSIDEGMFGSFSTRRTVYFSGSGFCGGANLNFLCRPAIGYAIIFSWLTGLLSSLFPPTPGSITILGNLGWVKLGTQSLVTWCGIHGWMALKGKGGKEGGYAKISGSFLVPINHPAGSGLTTLIPPSTRRRTSIVRHITGGNPC